MALPFRKYLPLKREVLRMLEPVILVLDPDGHVRHKERVQLWQMRDQHASEL